MKIQFATLTLLAASLTSGIMASSDASSGLVARHNKFPVKVTEDMISSIMSSIETQMKTQVVSKVATSYCDHVSASLEFDVGFGLHTYSGANGSGHVGFGAGVGVGVEVGGHGKGHSEGSHNGHGSSNGSSHSSKNGSSSKSSGNSHSSKSSSHSSKNSSHSDSKSHSHSSKSSSHSESSSSHSESSSSHSSKSSSKSGSKSSSHSESSSSSHSSSKTGIHGGASSGSKGSSTFEVDIVSVRKSIVRKLRSEFEADLNAEIKTKVYKEVELLLRSKCGSKKLTQKQLLLIIAEVEAKAKKCLQTSLPKIGTKLKFTDKKYIEKVLKKVNYKSTVIKKIAIGSSFSVKSSLKSSISIGVKSCTKLNATQSAKRIIKGLKELC